MALQDRIQQIETLRQSLNQGAIRLGKEHPVFREIYSIPAHYTCYEAGFLRLVSWLYMLYYESGQSEVRFLIDKFDVYQLDMEHVSRKHYKEVKVLRTTLQHNMDLDKAKGLDYKQISDAWFQRSIHQNLPTSAIEWQRCLSVLVDDAFLFLGDSNETVNLIEVDEFCRSIVDEWNVRSSRNHQPYEFDKIIEVVASEFGLEYFDVIKFRKQNAEMWLRELQLRLGVFDFQVESRKLIERDIIRKPVLPITAIDIMERFNIVPGKQVRELMDLATRIYIDKPCNKADLLIQLDQIVSHRFKIL